MSVPRCGRWCVHRLLTGKALAESSSCSYIAKPRRLLRRTASNVLRNIPEQDPDAKRAAPIDRRKAQPFVIREIASRGLVSSRAPPLEALQSCLQEKSSGVEVSHPLETIAPPRGRGRLQFETTLPRRPHKGRQAQFHS